MSRTDQVLYLVSQSACGTSRNRLLGELKGMAQAETNALKVPEEGEAVGPSCVSQALSVPGGVWTDP